MKRIVVAGLILLLSACSGSVGGKTPTPTPTPKVAERTFTTVSEFKDALVEVGYPCPDWTESNRVKLAAGSGNCSTADVLSVYVTDSALQEVITTLKSFPRDGALVVGNKWMLNVGGEDRARLWAERTGGTPVVWNGKK